MTKELDELWPVFISSQMPILNIYRSLKDVRTTLTPYLANPPAEVKALLQQIDMNLQAVSQALLQLNNTMTELKVEILMNDK